VRWQFGSNQWSKGDGNSLCKECSEANSSEANNNNYRAAAESDSDNSDYDTLELYEGDFYPRDCNNICDNCNFELRRKFGATIAITICVGDV
jgi:hypothetical protein